MLIVCRFSVSSGSDSDSDGGEKKNAERELFNFSKQSGKDVAAESGNSSAAEDEDDFNPFKMSGSEDEGRKLKFVTLKFGHAAHVMHNNYFVFQNFGDSFPPPPTLIKP